MQGETKTGKELQEMRLKDLTEEYAGDIADLMATIDKFRRL